MKLSNSDQYESVFITIDPIKNPRTYEARVNDLINGGLTFEEAEREALEPMEMELYYDPSASLFLVDPMGVENGGIYNPYSGEMMEDMDEIDD